jgi:hypothetical protein
MRRSSLGAGRDEFPQTLLNCLNGRRGGRFSESKNDSSLSGHEKHQRLELDWRSESTYQLWPCADALTESTSRLCRRKLIYGGSGAPDVSTEQSFEVSISRSQTCR